MTHLLGSTGEQEFKPEAWREAAVRYLAAAWKHINGGKTPNLPEGLPSEARRMLDEAVELMHAALPLASGPAQREAPQVLLTATSVRGDVTHARRPAYREAICGENNVFENEDPFDPTSAFACKRCLRHVIACSRANEGGR